MTTLAANPVFLLLAEVEASLMGAERARASEQEARAAMVRFQAEANAFEKTFLEALDRAEDAGISRDSLQTAAQARVDVLKASGLLGVFTVGETMAPPAKKTARGRKAGAAQEERTETPDPVVPEPSPPVAVVSPVHGIVEPPVPPEAPPAWTVDDDAVDSWMSREEPSDEEGHWGGEDSRAGHDPSEGAVDVVVPPAPPPAPPVQVVEQPAAPVAAQPAVRAPGVMPVFLNRPRPAVNTR